MQSVSIIGIGQIPIRKAYPDGLIEMGARAAKLALKNSTISFCKTLDSKYSLTLLSCPPGKIMPSKSFS